MRVYEGFVSTCNFSFRGYEITCNENRFTHSVYHTHIKSLFNMTLLDAVLGMIYLLLMSLVKI